MAYGVYSDIAHYCLTDKLALNMVFFAGGRGPQAKAFAWGWFAHNIGDSVAHPWVNGFTGRPYRDFRPSIPGAIDEVFNLTHMGIEGWVDKRHFAESLSDRALRGIEVKAEYEAFLPFWLDENIQQLVVDAYRLTYLNESCDSRPFTPPTKELVSDAGRNFAVTLGTLGFGDFVLDLVDLEVLDLELKKLALQRQEDVRLIRDERPWTELADVAVVENEYFSAARERVEEFACYFKGAYIESVHPILRLAQGGPGHLSHRWVLRQHSGGVDRPLAKAWPWARTVPRA